ncbi:MAG: membrane protein insertase YidC [Akkermansia sp.]|nr:membrane protein insertase YidC [Akkermansia sp.]
MDKKAWFVVSLCVVLLGLQWYMNSTKEEVAPAAQPAAQQTAATPAPEHSAAPAATAPSETTPAVTAAPQQPAAEATTIATLTARTPDGKEVARYSFRNIGGSIASVEMLGKVINTTRPELSRTNVLINSNPNQGIGTLMFGLSETAAPTFDNTVYTVLPAQTNDKQVTLVGRCGELIIRKVYTLKPLKVGEDVIDGNAFALDLKIDIQNTSGQVMEARNWGIYAGGMNRISTDEASYYTYFVTLDDGDFDKYDVGEFSPWFGKKKERILNTNGEQLEWAGVMNQYYASLIKPSNGSGNNTFYAAPTAFPLQVKGEATEGVELALGIPEFSLSPKTADMQGGQKNLSFSIFTGPKLNLMLDGMMDEFRMLDRIMDYGIFHPISYSMNWLINIFHSWFGNWGWSIVAMTFVVRLLIWPLYRKSYISMKRMSQLQPHMKELKEKYPNDPQKVNTGMMKLYQEYGISPLGGCLPMLLQIPIFFSFFYVLQTAAEFRGAEWCGWVTDLSQMDTVFSFPLMGWDVPVNVLPILMAATMIIQMHMTPATGDPTQVKIMRWMPLLFFVFCYTYPSALALYWTTTNVISIIQTLIIKRVPIPELTKVTPKKGGKKGFFQRMMEAQQAALAEQQRQQQRNAQNDAMRRR